MTEAAKADLLGILLKGGILLSDVCSWDHKLDVLTQKYEQLSSLTINNIKLFK